MNQVIELSGAGWTQQHQHGRLHALAEEYRQVLAARGRTPQHVSETYNKIALLLDSAALTEPSQITGSVVQRAIGKILLAGRAKRTCNAYLVAFKSFCQWMLYEQHMATNPLERLPRYNEQGDRRHRRTSFSEADLGKLLRVTAASTRVYRGIDGRARAELYHAAACTGLRRGTLELLTVSQFELNGSPALVRVRAEQLKDHEDLTVPIQADSARRLAGWLAGKMPETKAFRMPERWNVIRMLKADLLEAGIDYCQTVADGKTRRRLRVLDFHAFRGTFCTRGALAGVPLSVMQRWMGHSDPKLTANLYTMVLPPDVVAALGRVPAIVGTAAALL